jgi:tetratricopeptide (TPR) repeat protein
MIVWLQALAAAATLGTGPLDLPSVKDQVALAQQAAGADDCKRALPIAEAAMERPDFAAAGPTVVSDAQEIDIRCIWIGGDHDRAYAQILKATAGDGASDDLWGLRFVLEYNLGKSLAAVDTFAMLTRVRPKAATDIDVNLIAKLDDRLAADPQLNGARERLLAAAASDAYDPPHGVLDKDWLRLPYADLLLAKGQTAQAQDQVRRLVTPESVAIASIDGRYASAFPADFDVRRAQEQMVVYHQYVLSRHLDRLQDVNQAARDLRLLGRAQESLAVLDQAMARLDAADRAAPSQRKPTFTDLADYQNWFWNERADTLRDLGREDEAMATYDRAAATGEDGRLNVSQTINRAESYSEMGRGEDALKALEVTRDPAFRPSKYGRAQVNLTYACAYAQTGRAAQAAKAVEYLKAHEADAPDALTDGLICVGDLDGAAASVIRRLKDPGQRQGMLLFLCDYDDPPVAPRKPDPNAAGWKTLKARADIRAAAAEVGTLRRFHVRPFH